MRILLTGGAGYVGSACLRGLLAAGHDAVAYDNLSAGNALSVPAARLVVGDIHDKSSLVKAINDQAAEAVMHFAAVASVPESISDPDLYWRTNLAGTKNVLDALRATGVRKMLLSSTAATYSFDVDMPVVETSTTRPRTPYGTSKLAAEHLVLDYARAYGLDCTILRYFNAAGADLDGEFGECRAVESHLIPLLFKAVLTGVPIKIYGTDWDTRDGSCIRDYIHTQDLMNAHRVVFERLESGTGSIYNVGSNSGTSVLEVLAACERVAGRPIPCEFAPRRHGDPAVLIADSRKLRQQYDWRPLHDLATIVESAWSWHQRYPNGYRDKRCPGSRPS